MLRGGSCRSDGTHCCAGAGPYGPASLGRRPGDRRWAAAKDANQDQQRVCCYRSGRCPSFPCRASFAACCPRRTDPSRVCCRVCLVAPAPSNIIGAPQRVCFACSLGGWRGCRFCSASDALHGGGQTDAEGVVPDASTDGHDQRSARREQLAQKVCGLEHRPPIYLCTVCEASWCMSCTSLGTCKWAGSNGGTLAMSAALAIRRVPVRQILPLKRGCNAAGSQVGGHSVRRERPWEGATARESTLTCLQRSHPQPRLQPGVPTRVSFSL